MQSWQLQQAKAHLSELVKSASNGKPQEITLRGKLQSNLKGHVLPAINGLLAATALSHNLRLVTRNEKDFICCSLDVINPWN